jgi:hypothetical protein
MLGKDKVIPINETISINNQQLEKIPQECTEDIRDFSDLVSKQHPNNQNISGSILTLAQESVDELVKKADVKPCKKPRISKKIESKTKFVDVAKNIWAIPKTETVDALTCLPYLITPQARLAKVIEK